MSDAVAAVNEEAIEMWSAGRSAEGCRLLRDFLDGGPRLKPDEELYTKVTLALCERGLLRYRESRETLMGVARLAEETRDLVLRGKFHNGLALCHQNLGDRDAARLEFTAASVYYEGAGEPRMRADVENNLAVLEQEAGNLEEAALHLERAFRSYPNASTLAQWQDTEARIALAAGQSRPALAASLRSVRRLLADKDKGRLLVQYAGTLMAACQLLIHEEEASRIRSVLELHDWNITRAAAALGFSKRQGLQQHLRLHFPELNAERIRRNNRIASRG